MDYSQRPALGFTERVIIVGKGGKKKELKGRVDTGATKSSIDVGIAKELGLGPSIGERLVKSSNGQFVRSLIWVNLEISGKNIREQFTIADRSHLRYKLLIGQNIIRLHGFFVDPLKK